MSFNFCWIVALLHFTTCNLVVSLLCNSPALLKLMREQCFDLRCTDWIAAPLKSRFSHRSRRWRGLATPKTGLSSVCHWIGGSINMSFVIKQTGETGDRYQPVSKIATTLLNPKILPPTTIKNHATLICLSWFGKNLDEKFINRRILWILLWWY